MRVRGAAIQGGLAALGLLAAYFTWQREPVRAASAVTVVDLSRKELRRVVYSDGPREVTVERAGDEYWVTVGTASASASAPKPAGPGAGTGTDAGTGSLSYPGSGSDTASAADAGSVASGTADAGISVARDAGTRGATPPVAAAVPPRKLRGNEAAAQLFQRLAPLEATRALGELDAQKRKELGLEGSNRRLALEGDGRTHRFVVSSNPPGFGSSYLRAESGGPVFLISGGPISDLDAASSRLVERRLHDWGSDVPDALTVRTGGKTRELVSIPSSDATRAPKWASKQTPQAVDELASTWQDRISRPVVTDLLGRGETPASGDVRVELRLDYARRGKPMGFLELGKSGADHYGRTEHTAGWVKLAASTGDLLRESEKIVGASK